MSGMVKASKRALSQENNPVQAPGRTTGTSLENGGVLGIVPFTGLAVATTICTGTKRPTLTENSGEKRGLEGAGSGTAGGNSSR